MSTSSLLDHPPRLSLTPCTIPSSCACPRDEVPRGRGGGKGRGWWGAPRSIRKGSGRSELLQLVSNTGLPEPPASHQPQQERVAGCFHLLACHFVGKKEKSNLQGRGHLLHSSPEATRLCRLAKAARSGEEERLGCKGLMEGCRVL